MVTSVGTRVFAISGAYRGDDSAVFLDIVVSDNDIRAPAKPIKEQHGIIVSAVDKIAEHIPDIGHVIKDYNNELYRIREKDPSFRGATLLANDWIRVIMSDVLSSLLNTNPTLEIRRHSCFASRGSMLLSLTTVVIIPDTNGRRCVGIKRSERIIRHGVMTKSRQSMPKTGRFHGKAMGLSIHGITVLKRVLFKRFD